jgi:hypothetical protein
LNHGRLEWTKKVTINEWLSRSFFITGQGHIFIDFGYEGI